MDEKLSTYSVHLPHIHPQLSSQLLIEAFQPLELTLDDSRMGLTPGRHAERKLLGTYQESPLIPRLDGDIRSAHGRISLDVKRPDHLGNIDPQRSLRHFLAWARSPSGTPDI